MMKREQLDRFRRALISRADDIRKLEADSSEAAGTVVLDQSKVGRLSRMDALLAQQMARETSRRRQLQLKKIEGALRRLDTGEYGYCLLCGEEIGMARLDSDPASTRCMACMDD